MTLTSGAAGLPKRSSGPPRDLVLAGHCLRFTADAQGLTDDALAVLAPPCSIARPSATNPGWSIHIALASVSAGRRRGHPVLSWADIGRRLELVDVAGGRLVLAGQYRQGSAETLIEVDAQSQRTRLLLPSGDEPSRRWPDWVGRMFFGTRLLADGWYLMHAAAVSVDTDVGPQAVVFLAGSHGGKSTLAHRASVELSAKFMSDDLVLLRPSSGGVIAVGWPTRVSIPLELLNAVTHERPTTATALNTFGGSSRRHRLVLSPHEYASMFDIQRTGPTMVGAVVVVSPTSATSPGRHGLEVDGSIGVDRLGSALTVAAQIPAQRLMMLDLLGVAGPPAQLLRSTEIGQAGLLAALRSAEVAVVGLRVPDMSRLPSLPVWDALAAHLPWIMGSAS